MKSREVQVGDQTLVHGAVADGDWREILRKPRWSRPESYDLTVTSPPYDLGKEHDVGEGLYQYLRFTRDWLHDVFVMTRPNGRLCLNIPLDTSYGKVYTPLYSLVMEEAREVGWEYKTTIVWNEGNISRRTAWGSWRRATAPHVIAPVEMIAVLYKGGWPRSAPDGSNPMTVPAKDFQEWTNGLWTFPGESATRIGHPAPFPGELPSRCIQLFSFPGDRVLDPFMGSGTTLIAAHRAGRVGVGVEKDPRYFRLALARLKREVEP
ncbi:MAG: site-specific DNA-methyltransferase [Euryarchaeota archaeon]|nr:site-specific DNA-methyltransferase [Euryarchaeota archaeon]